MPGTVQFTIVPDLRSPGASFTITNDSEKFNCIMFRFASFSE